ncbi:YggT family protein [Phototrophicus methaneseepsis]|uniref:YggT family protein n=1 Tax=Phototrophicus methaneseepsis TaxID=2710758 RepID=A0A7S8ICR9_9CHLR|nr:YggT family protein [Phototrophicus methaneseepsis]QPC80594.1 YggT family protein [Phototrophicus methaneseepsis]
MGIVVAIIVWALQIFSFILMARVLMTWIPNLDYSNPIVRFLLDVTEPVLQPIRNALPSASGMDFSPIVAFLGIWVLRMLLISVV